MSKELQDCFFDELHEHSLAKLNLLKNYAVKWMRKVTLGTMQKKCAIIDTFAGTGYYEDGSDRFSAPAPLSIYIRRTPALSQHWHDPHPCTPLFSDHRERL